MTTIKSILNSHKTPNRRTFKKDNRSDTRSQNKRSKAQIKYFTSKTEHQRTHIKGGIHKARTYTLIRG